MPEFIVVQCFKCSQFQVSQFRKDKKFSCKLCGAKQSVRKIFARSHAAKDCREFVQGRNFAHGVASERYDELQFANADSDGLTFDHDPHEEEAGDNPNTGRHERTGIAEPGRSRWSAYVRAVTLDKKPSLAAGTAPDLDGSHEGSDEGDEFVTALPDKGNFGRKRSGGMRRESRTSKRGRRSVPNPTHQETFRNRGTSGGNQNGKSELFDQVQSLGPSKRKDLVSSGQFRAVPQQGEDEGLTFAAPGIEEEVEDEIVF